MEDGVIILGAGGHAKVIMSILLANEEKVAYFVDDKPELVNKKLHGYSVVSSEYLENQKDVLVGRQAIIGTGNNLLRKKIAEAYPFFQWKTVVHPKAYVHDSVKLGPGTIVCAGAVIQIDSIVESHVIINTSASVDHDCRIGHFAHVAPGTRLAGNVTIGNGALVGINSCAIYGQVIGDWSTVGAGSVIVRPIESHAFAKGVPAKVYKKIAEKME